jgi:DNA-binding transcriptional ArsR family regulator
MARSIKTAKIERMAETMRYLGDPSRCALILYLQQQGTGLYVHEIADALEVSHSAASHQLGTLLSHGIVEDIREGQMVRYVLAKTPAAKRALRLFRALER